MSDLTRLPASDLRLKIAAKEISPVDLMMAVLARAEALQPVLNCFITLVPKQEGEVIQACRGVGMLGAQHPL